MLKFNKWSKKNQLLDKCWIVRLIDWRNKLKLFKLKLKIWTTDMVRLLAITKKSWEKRPNILTILTNWTKTKLKIMKIRSKPWNKSLINKKLNLKAKEWRIKNSINNSNRLSMNWKVRTPPYETISTKKELTKINKSKILPMNLKVPSLPLKQKLITWPQEIAFLRDNKLPWNRLSPSKIGKLRIYRKEPGLAKKGRRNWKDRMINSEVNLSRKIRRPIKCSMSRRKDLRYFCFYSGHLRFHHRQP